MAKWAYCDRLKHHSKAHQLRTGMTQEQIAEALETTLPTYRNFLYGSKKPSTSFLQRAAALFGCSVLEFMDDAGAEIAGAVPDSSEMDRFMLRVMGSDITKLTDAQKQSAFEAWRAIVRGYEPSK